MTATAIPMPPIRADSPAPSHHFTVDVEEHFQVTALERIVPRERWADQPSRVEANVERLLALLAEHGARGTFFVLGMVAERNPGVVRAIAEGGHEVASHGWDHQLVTRLEPEEFRASVRRSRALLEDLCGREVVGFRAPSFSIVPGREWALDLLVEEGYRYDSSLFPIRRSGYGYAAARREPHVLERPAGRLAEFPPLTLRLSGLNLPAGGGAYFRLFPYGLVRSALRALGDPPIGGTFYIHPWEIDPRQPRYAVPWKTRIRHYGGLARTAGRLARLLAEFPFTRTLAEAERSL